MLLDTTFLVDVLRGENGVAERERDLDDRGVGTISSVSVMELWEGIQRAEASENERAAVEQLLTGLSEASFDRETAKRAGALNVELADRGEPIDVEDVMIAATALERDDPVLTRNDGHFERIDALDLETY